MDKLKKAQSSNNVFQLLGRAIDSYYNDKDVSRALTLIEFALRKDTKVSFAYQLKSEIQISQGKIDEALNTLNKGLNVDSFNYILLWKKAEILAFNKSQFKDALEDINRAINNFEMTSTQQQSQLSRLKNRDSNNSFLKNYTSNKIDLISTRQNIINSEASSKLFLIVKKEQDELTKRILKNEEYIREERFRNIELLGIFTAVLGFILTNVLKVPTFNTPIEVFNFNLAFGIPLIIFVYFIHNIFNK